MITRPTIVGAGWIGTALGRALDAPVIPRRAFDRSDIPAGAHVVVASGRSAVAARESFGAALREELAHLRQVLEACERAGAERVVVLGTSDVVGLAPIIDGSTPQSPVTAYAKVKTSVEDEVVRWADRLPISVVRLAPVHGPGKDRTASLVRMSNLPVVPLPYGCRVSVGFILLDDAVGAVQVMLTTQTAPVVAVGAGTTPLPSLLRAMAACQGKNLRIIPLPTGVRLPTAAGHLPLSDRGHWLIRLALPRTVRMDVDAPVAPLETAAEVLVRC